MKIAYLVNQYPKVSHSFIRREILALERQGLEVFRFAIRGWSDPLPDAEDLAERERTRYVLRAGPLALLAPSLLTLLSAPRRFLRALALTIRISRESDRSLFHHLVYLAEACQVLRWLKGTEVQHLHAHFGTNSTDVALLVRVLGGPPYSFTVHGPEEFYRAIGLREKVTHATFVVAISSFCRSQVYLWSRYSDWAKISVIRCGIEPAFYASAPQVSGREQRLICVGRLAPEKGHLLLIETAALLARKGLQFEIMFAGDGPLRHEMEALIARHDLTARVSITGWISSNQVRDAILASRALVQPSFAEGLPVVIMEAMALRRPVVATYIAGIPELVINGATGWVVPAASPTALAAAIEDCLLKTADEIRELGECGHARAIANHSVDVEAEKLAHLFKQAGGTPLA